MEVAGEYRHTQGYWEWAEDILAGSAQTLKAAKIYDPVYASLFTYDRNPNILQAFLKAWCPTTNTLLTSAGELSISLWDLYKIGGLPIRGFPYEEVVPNAIELTGVDEKHERFIPCSCEFLFVAFQHLQEGEASNPRVPLSKWIKEREEFFEEILDKISVVPSIAKYHVGIKPRIEKVKSLLNVESGGVYFVGLWGLGGVGKTTIASGIFDEISSQFEGSCFLAIVRSVLKMSGLEVLQHLQQKLLSQILKKDSVNVPHFATGDEMISQMLRFKEVLIVLDDMDDSQQLEYLVGKRDWFGDGTRVITTTRNLDLLSKHDVLYRVPELTNHEALELFSWHAFQQGTPVEGFEELSCCVVDYAKGLPLALGVLGSFLYKQGTEEHINALYRGKDFRDGKIVRLLSLSLDALDDYYKNMFLHIACFLRGKKKKDVITVLDRLGIKRFNGINVLKRSFLYISEGKVEMHDSIAQIGQQMARDAEWGKPWNRSRLWHEKDMKNIFSANQISRTLTFPIPPQNESIQKWKYDAFLSFRGDDTHNNFVAHLYKRLEDTGINVFKDDVRLERGKFISRKLSKAVQESRIAIIIFSGTMLHPPGLCKGGRSSFAKALEKHVEDFKANFEKSVIKHKAEFKCGLQKVLANETALALGEKDETNLKDNLEKVQRWKDALHRAAGIAGLDVRKTANGLHWEGKRDRVRNEVIRENVGVALVEDKMRNEAESIDKIINDNFRNTHHTVSATEKYLVGIESRMSAVESLLKFRSEESKKHGLLYLQKTLLSRLLNEKSKDIASLFEGADMIKRKLCRLKVLIVFDDVDEEHQLEYLAGNHDWFGGGSRIITTTRNQDLLRSHDQLYSVPELAKDEALEVFSWHAFQKRTPDKEFLKLSKSVVDYAKGLPLALKLSLSLDGLNHEEKNIFLDIACFFRGRKRDDVITILNSFGFRLEIGIHVLIQKSLLYISEGMVEMHDLIEQMGQQAARNVDQDRPWNHSRLWHEQDIKNVFSANLRTESIKGIMVPIGSDRHICKWSKAFRNMPCLRLLIVKGEEARHHDPICDPIEYLPSNLKWLDWSYYSLATLPAEFEPGNLGGLNMTFSSLVEIFKEPKAFDKLTVLNLSFSGSLLRTPNFSDTPNLQKIILKSCVSLVEIHPSVGNFKKLIFLNMENCKNLESLPSSIQMESLESLNLSGCQKLENFPEIRGNMELLSELLLARSAIWELPPSIGQLCGVSLLDLRSCEKLVRLPASVSKMRKLKILIVKGCSRLPNFPETLGDLNQMEELYAGNSAIWKLSDSIGNLSKLKVLSLRRGRKVKHQTSCSLMLPSYWGFYGLRELKSLDLSGCNLSDNLTVALTNLPSLVELNLSRNKFISLPDSIRQLSHLRYLDITHCQELKELPTLPPNIEELYAEDFLAKRCIANLPMYPRLNLVSFTNYCFDQQSNTEDSSGSSVLDEILRFYLLNNMDDVVQTSLNSDYRVTFSMVFPERAIPTWFKHQSVEEKMLFKLPIGWYNEKFKGFAICCVTPMGKGVCSPDSGLSAKYDYTFIKARLKCNDQLEDLKVLVKECKVGTSSRTHGWCVCFVYIPLYASLQVSGTSVGDINHYSLFEASIQGRIVRQWGVDLIYEDEGIISKSSSLEMLRLEEEDWYCSDCYDGDG
ncbi:hypothetical protein CQW23_14839 [Capsicum baccatum]|uniref:ADP-ribosyl cyclase/cyclic ADP-ribose hydrolase n=1 Tax=Capsicum baccatum TaxID=33114 RepID=A0A2G2WKC2_CAPBA|nr:hypothetical protein CQW23_14839 [Capsicum baccatum]